MLVVSDTGPIISLLKVNRLELLRDLYEQVIVPTAVFDELTGNPAFLNEANRVRECGYIVNKSVDNALYVSSLRRGMGLDAGESEAIALADELMADVLLIDEQNGRMVARNMGLSITGTIGILADAYESKLLSGVEVEECMTVLRVHSRYIGSDLYKWLQDKIAGNEGE